MTRTRGLRFRLPVLLAVFALAAIPLAARSLMVRRHAAAYVELQRLSETHDISIQGHFEGQTRLFDGGPPHHRPGWLSRWLGFRGASQVALYGDQLGDPEAALLGRLLHLQTVELFGTDVTGAGLASLPASTTQLLLVGPNRDPRLLEGVRHLKQLRRLSISQVSATEVDLGFLADLPSLRHLVLWNTGLSPQQEQSLRRELPDATIEVF